MTNCSSKALDKRVEMTIDDRRKAVMMILERVQLDVGLPPLDNRILLSRAVSWEEHLTDMGCKPKDYERVYKLAIQNYTNKGPFGIYELLNAWRQIRDMEQRNNLTPRWESKNYDSQETGEEKCKRCNGMSLVRRSDEDREILDSYDVGSAMFMRCPECCLVMAKKAVEPMKERE
jgi:hypothetical protein